MNDHDNPNTVPDSATDQQDMTPDGDTLARLLYEHIADAVIVHDPGGEILTVNDGAVRLFGDPAETLVGTDLKSYVLPTYSDVFAVNIQNARERGEAFFETAFLRQERKTVHAEVKSSIVTFHGRQAVLTIVHDITERVHAEEDLQYRKNMFRAVIHAIGDGVLVLDTEGRIIIGNPAAERTFGRKREDMIGDNVDLLLDLTSLPQFRALLGSCFEKPPGGMSATIEVKGLRPNGTIFPLECSVSCGTYGKTHFAIVVCRDITERQRTEAVLRESDERFRFITSASGDMIHLYDEQGAIMYVNPASEQILGYRQDELLHRPVISLVHPADREGMSNLLSRLLAGDRTMKPREIRFMSRNGDVIVTECSGFLNRLAPDLVAVGAIIRDVTDRKRRDAEIRQEARLDAVATVAQGIANDFNNMLSTVVGNISLAKTAIDNDHPAADMLKTAENAGLQARHLVRQLLAISGDQAPEMLPLDIGDIVREAVEFTFRGTRVTGTVSLPEALPAVRGDAEHLTQALHQIMRNSEQAMPRGGTVEITVERQTHGDTFPMPIDPGVYVVIGIRDRGVGVPADIADYIFDPYVTTKANRSGLGLTIAYATIRKHDGHITFRSNPDGGTTFYIYLPASGEPALRRERAPERRAAISGRVLVMDDEEGVQDVAKRMLEYLGHEVETAANGEEALEQFENARRRETPFDAVILDLSIAGGLGGEETMRRLRELDPEIRAIVSSGVPDNPVMRNFRQFGFRGVIPKPYEIGQLRDIVDAVMAGGSPEQEERPPAALPESWVGSHGNETRFRRRF